MYLYSNNKNILTEIKEKPFKLEKDLQNLIEKNLFTLMGLTIIKTEFSTKDMRFDTLAYDEQSKSFVIIEYKRDKHSSIVDQGFAYLNHILNNKSDAVLELCKKFPDRINKETEIDWSQTKIIFIARSFTDYQKKAADSKTLPIELWECKQYVNGVFLINKLQKQNTENKTEFSKISIQKDKVSKEIKIYTEEQHLDNKSEYIKELYSDFKAGILNLDPSIDIIPRKMYIAFKLKTNICDIEIQKKSLCMCLNAKWGSLDEPKKLFRNMENIGHFGNGDYSIIIKDTKNLEYILSVIKQLL